MHIEEQLRDRKQAARFLNISPQTLDRIVRSGDLACVKVSKSLVRFRLDDLVNYIERRVQCAGK
jgi:excisionase family DNA binding protein